MEEQNIVNGNLNTRVTKLEGTVEAISRDLTRLGTTIDESMRRIERATKETEDALDKKIGLITEDYQRSRRPNWQLLIGLLTFLITIGSLAAAAALSPIYIAQSYLSSNLEKFIESSTNDRSTLHKDIARIEDQLNIHEKIGSHPRSEERFVALRDDYIEVKQSSRQALADLDQKLQTALHNLQEKFANQIQQVDRRLQSEMRLLDELTAAGVKHPGLKNPMATTPLLNGNGGIP